MAGFCPAHGFQNVITPIILLKRLELNARSVVREKLSFVEPRKNASFMAVQDFLNANLPLGKNQLKPIDGFPGTLDKKKFYDKMVKRFVSKFNDWQTHA